MTNEDKPELSESQTETIDLESLNDPREVAKLIIENQMKTNKLLAAIELHLQNIDWKLWRATNSDK